MKFKKFIDAPCDMRFMLENIDLHTSFAKRMLLNSSLINDKLKLENNYRKLQLLMKVKQQSLIYNLLCSVKDIEKTISNLTEGLLLQETELFELKNFAYYSNQIRKWLAQNAYEYALLPDLEKVFNILDPDTLKTTSFHIYNSYSETLAVLRNKAKELQFNIEDEDNDKVAEIYALIEQEEEKVRIKLTRLLKEYSIELKSAFLTIGSLDIDLAKINQIIKLNLCLPVISGNDTTIINGMFHPLLKNVLETENKNYQPVDISFNNETVCITGANMGGKTVVIKSVALVQILFQFGFGIPAQYAEISIKDNILFSIDEGQNMNKGLSSFAAEMLGINNILKLIKNGYNILAVIDEPARTTNPKEGTALVEGLIETLKNKKSSVLITTHYDISDEDIKRYRVKGLINGIMNYELIEAKKGDVPQEALNIARTLGIDEDWINAALKRTHLNNN